MTVELERHPHRVVLAEEPDEPPSDDVMGELTRSCSVM
jgi:hypothetical protein